jgi:hypothetical protein
MEMTMEELFAVSTDIQPGMVVNAGANKWVVVLYAIYYGNGDIEVAHKTSSGEVLIEKMNK